MSATEWKSIKIDKSIKTWLTISNSCPLQILKTGHTVTIPIHHILRISRIRPQRTRRVGTEITGRGRGLPRHSTTVTGKLPVRVRDDTICGRRSRRGGSPWRRWGRGRGSGGRRGGNWDFVFHSSTGSWLRGGGVFRCLRGWGRGSDVVHVLLVRGVTWGGVGVEGGWGSGGFGGVEVGKGVVAGLMGQGGGWGETVGVQGGGGGVFHCRHHLRKGQAEKNRKLAKYHEYEFEP